MSLAQLLVIFSMQGFEIYEEEYVLLREKVPELDEWDKSTVSTVLIYICKMNENIIEISSSTFLAA